MMKLFFSSLFILQMVLLMGQTAPVANNDTVSLPENGPVVPNSYVIVPVTQNDVDAGGGALSVTVLSQPAHGSALVVNTNQVFYSPTQGFYGADSFYYSACDTFHLCDTAKVYIHVLGSNLPPVALADIFMVSDTSYATSLNVLSNDSDPHHDSIFVTSILPADTSGAIGAVTLDSATGQIFFLHAANQCGAENFYYVVCNYSLCDTAQITVIVNCPDSIGLPQGFSPNGDGKNDLLVFPGVQFFQPVNLNVFNRYGTTVYQNANYQNDWDGTDVDSHHPLPDGTYYYVLQLANGHSYNNYLVINR